MKKIYKLQRGGIAWCAAENPVATHENAFLPPLAVVPFLHHEGVSSELVVKAGETVKEGQVIAVASAQGALPVHSPIPGLVVRICTVPVGNDTCVDAAVIKMSGAFSLLGKIATTRDWHTISPKDILQSFQNFGIVNNASVPSSLYAESFAVRESGAVLVVRLFDRDPAVVMDSFLTETYMQEVVEGAALVARSIDASSVIFAAGKSFYDTIEQRWIEVVSSVFSRTAFPALPVETCVFKERYPIGGKKEIIESLQTSCLAGYDKDILYIDATTAYTVAHAVIENSPVLERFVYVSGSALSSSPALLKVRIGTRIGAVIDECGGFSTDPARIVVNGLFAGSAVYDLDTPVTKSTSSITVLSKDDFPEYEITDCISCGACITVCPSALNPMQIFNLIRNHRETDAFDVGGGACSFCGCCSAVCPARLPLAHIFRRLTTRSALRQEVQDEEHF